jgi:gamma-glutamyltranspeptidase/glutathione hydrolase
MPINSSGMFTAQPGHRIVTPMAPVIAFKGDKPYFATGSAGGTLNTFLTTLNVLAWDKNLQEAQEAPRLRAPGPDEMKLTVEHRIDKSVVDELETRGYRIEWAGPYWMRNAQMAGIDPETGIRYGAADPRGEGHAAGQK